MAKNYGISKKVTHQTESARSDQVKNNAGGFIFKITPIQQLRRFLILGSTNGAYYVNERKLTKNNFANLENIFNSESIAFEAIDEIVKVSSEGLAPKNDPALLALAVACSSSIDSVRKYAFIQLPKVARIGTHLFTFVTYISELRGWGKGLQRAISKWYDSKGNNLAYQICKYPQRRVEGCLPWSHRDILRKIHMVPNSKDMEMVFRYAVKGREGFTDEQWEKIKDNDNIRYIYGHECAKQAASSKEVVSLVKEYNLARESIPNNLFTADVYKALLPHMGLTALIRNLSAMTKEGVLKPLSKETSFVVDKLTNEVELQKARIHPYELLVALEAYKAGIGRHFSWTPTQQIVSALEDAFYKAFKFIEPTGKRFMLALDVSGSMRWASSIIANTNITAAQGAAAMAMATLRTEKNAEVMAFAGEMKNIGITKNDSLELVMQKTSRVNAGYTDCAQPILHALKHKLEVDVFVIYTDNETYVGDIHPFQALKKYRTATGIDAKLVVVGMTSTGFSIADPTDAGSLDVVGFDASCPQMISNFAVGNL